MNKIGGFSPNDFTWIESRESLPDWAESFWYRYEQLMVSTIPGDLKEAFGWIEAELFDDTYAYIREGMTLKMIQVYKLYTQAGFKSFKDYCQKRRRQSVWWVSRIMRAAQVGWHLLCEGFTNLPTNVSQAIALYEPLMKQNQENYDLVETWEDVLQASEHKNKNITTSLINRIAQPDKKEKIFFRVEISKNNADKLKKEAQEYGVSVQEMLDGILRERYGAEEDSGGEAEEDSVSPETETSESVQISESKNDRWISDLNQLTSQYEEKNVRANPT